MVVRGARQEAAGGAWEAAASVPDPEMPFLTVADLGILRDVRDDHGTTVVTVTPTYSGCPAVREIMIDVRSRVERAGFAPVEVRTALTPPWTTDWITDEGRRKLAAAGIAPPGPAPAAGQAIPLTLRPRPDPVACPRCGSTDTAEQSRFGATACRALWRCRACREPFEHVKAI